MFKYELGQLIFYMRDSKVHSAPALSRMRVENLHENWDCNEVQLATFLRFGPSQTIYGTTHGPVTEEEAFATKRDLIESL